MSLIVFRLAGVMHMGSFAFSGCGRLWPMYCIISDILIPDFQCPYSFHLELNPRMAETHYGG